MTGININEYQTKVSEEHANVKNNKMQEQSYKALPRDDCSGFLLSHKALPRDDCSGGFFLSLKALPRDDCSGFLLFVSGVSHHFQQYFSYIATVIIIDVRNWSIR